MYLGRKCHDVWGGTCFSQKKKGIHEESIKLLVTVEFGRWIDGGSLLKSLLFLMFEHLF